MNCNFIFDLDECIDLKKYFTNDIYIHYSNLEVKKGLDCNVLMGCFELSSLDMLNEVDLLKSIEFIVRGEKIDRI